MPSIMDRVDLSTLILFFVTALAGCTRFAAAAITIYLATTLPLNASAFALAMAASISELLAIATFFAAFASFLRRPSRQTALSFWVPAVMMSLLGTVLSIATLSLAIRSVNTAFMDEGEDTVAYELAAAGLTIGIIGLIPQAAFYALIWPHSEPAVIVPVGVSTQRPSPPRSVKQPRYIAIQMTSISPSSAPVFRTTSEPTSRSNSVSTFSPRPSGRTSANQVLRPMTSKTRLLLTTSFTSAPRDSKSIDSIIVDPMTLALRNNHDFEHWDTSAVEEKYRNQFATKKRTTKLETIPGSRPVSPAKPLDRPCEIDISAADIPLPDSPFQSPTVACASPTSETGSVRVSRPTLRRPSTSNSNDQSHIHPLFRMESPAPPPLASPGTIITASPYAGQVVSPDIAKSPRRLNSAHGSLPSTPSFLLLPPPRSRPGSVKNSPTLPSTSSAPAWPLVDEPSKPAVQLPAPHWARQPDD